MSSHFCAFSRHRRILQKRGNRAEKLGLFFFRGGSDGTFSRGRGPGRRGRQGAGGGRGAGGDPAGRAECGQAGRVLGARWGLRAGEPPPAASPGAAAGLARAAAKSDWGGDPPASGSGTGTEAPGSAT